MVSTIHRLIAALDVKARLPHAGWVRAKPAANVHHVIFSMLLAVFAYRVAYKIEVCLFRAVIA